MAYINATSPAFGQSSVAKRLGQLGTKLRARLSRHLVYRATRIGLSSLSDHQLEDIGLDRGLIKEMAAKLAHKA